MGNIQQTPGDEHPVIALHHCAQELPRLAQAAYQILYATTPGPGRQRLPGGTGKNAQRSSDRVGGGRRGRAEGAEQAIEPKITLSRGTRGGDEIGTLTQMLSLTHQLQWSQRLRKGELRLSHRMLHRLWISIDKERLDRNDVPLHRKGPQQQLGEVAGLLGIRIGTSLLSHVAGDA